MQARWDHDFTTLNQWLGFNLDLELALAFHPESGFPIDDRTSGLIESSAHILSPFSAHTDSGKHPPHNENLWLGSRRKVSPLAGG